MAIKLITGKPGAGKTYFAVHHLKTNFFQYDKSKKKYVPNKDCTIITNIRDLKLDHLDLQECMEKSRMNVNQFFSKANQEKISQKYPKIIYLIDECQGYFDRKFYDKEVFFYFQTHRHLGHDIYLITQDQKLIPQQIFALIEYEIYAQARSVSVFGELKYIVKVGNEPIDRKLLKKDKSVFRLYKSQSEKETESLRNPFMKYVGVMIILLGIAVYIFYNYFLMPEKVVAKIGEEPKHSKSKNFKKKQGISISPETEGIISGEIRLKEKKIPSTMIKLNYVILANDILILDPITSTLLPVAKVPYKVTIDKIGRSLLVIGYVPSHLLPSPDDQVKSEKGLTRPFSDALSTN